MRRGGKSLASLANLRVEYSRLVLENVEIGAGKTTFPDRRKESILVHGVPATDVDDHALLRQAANEPRIEEIIRAGVGGKREDKPVGAPKQWAERFFLSDVGCRTSLMEVLWRENPVSRDSEALDAKWFEARGDRASDTPKAGD